MEIYTLLDKMVTTPINECKVFEPIKPNEEAIADVPEELRRVSSYLDGCYSELRKMKAEAEAEDSKAATRAIEAKMEKLSKEYEFARTILWREIRAHVESIPGDKHDLGIRQGWIVVRERLNGPTGTA